MDDKVIPIKPGLATGVATSQPELAKMLRDLADQAEEGELVSLIGTGFTTHGTRLAVWFTQPGQDVYSTLGSIAWLEHEYVYRMTEYDDAD